MIQLQNPRVDRLITTWPIKCDACQKQANRILLTILSMYIYATTPNTILIPSIESNVTIGLSLSSNPMYAHVHIHIQQSSPLIFLFGTKIYKTSHLPLWLYFSSLITKAPLSLVDANPVFLFLGPFMMALPLNPIIQFISFMPTRIDHIIL